MLVEDRPEVRVMVRTAVRLRPDMEVVAEAGTSRSARKLLVTARPDVVVLDLVLPDAAGRNTFVQIREAAPESSLVVYSVRASDRDWYEDQGTPFVAKDADLDDLIRAIETVTQRGRG
jgi:DNA-binding NarL/FixJ family response regulator